MTRRSGMVAGLLFLVFLALALATCVTWPPMPEPVTRGPGVGLLEATAVPTIFPTYTPGPTSTPTPTATATATATATPTNCRTYIADDVPLSIPNNGSDVITSTIVVTDTFYVYQTRVKLSITKDNVAMMQFGLMAPDSSQFVTFIYENASGKNFTATIFDDSAGRTIAEGHAPYTGSFQPLESFAYYINGITSNRNWGLRIYDGLHGSAGTLTSFELTLCGGAATPTPTPTNAATLTPSPTPTPTLTPWPTLTPRFTPSPTPTATLTPNWPVQNCPQLAVTLDGSLTEWAAVTPVALNVGAAAEVLIAPSLRATWTPVPTATPKTGAGTATVTPRPTATTRPTSTPAPAVADFAGLLYCAHDGAGTLYLAGELTDSQIVNPVGLLINGDAAEISLDMYADNFRQPGRDDHVITIAPNGRTADFAIYPLGATAATGAAAGLWRFELALPATTHGRAGLDTGDVIGGTWGYYDSRGGASWAYRLTAAKRRMVLQ
jgi:subtilisin-like proprotein convertase family protein